MKQAVGLRQSGVVRDRGIPTYARIARAWGWKAKLEAVRVLVVVLGSPSLLFFVVSGF